MDYVLRADDAEVVVGDEREGSAALAGYGLEDDRSGFCDGYR